ncbi:MAG: PDZ domain-containing protein [Fuerstiella sp.]
MKLQTMARGLLCLFLLGSASGSAHADPLSEAVRSAMAKAGPSVVRIRTIGTPDGEEGLVSSQVTTGVVISEQGDVLTSVFGFLSDPAAVFIEDSDGRRVAAEVVAKDHVRKLVLLKCSEGRFQAASGSIDRWPPVGAWAVALGRLYPGDQPSASVGIISAVGRIHGLAVQTDAKISPVNYGGPLIDLQGRVTGILVPLSPQDSGEAIRAGVEWYDSGIGFAIPYPDALAAAEVLQQGQDRVRGVLGIRPSTKNPLAEEPGIEFVFPESPAAEAGLQKGDRIVEARGVPITRFGIFDSLVRSSYAGDSFSLVVRRGDERLELELKLAARLQRPRRGYLGLIVDQEVGKAEDDTFGIRVHVLPGSPAATAGLPESTVLAKWGDEILASASDLQKQLQRLVAGTTVTLSYRPPDNPAEQAQVMFEAVERPQQLVEPTDAIIRAVAAGDAELTWDRQEIDLGESGKAWTFAPTTTAADVSSGLVLLLSESDTPQEVVLKRWEEHCRRHNLILVVPVNAEETGLTREDASLVTMAMFRSLVGRSVDISRSVLVTREAQADLCSDLLLNPRLRQLRAAAYVESWPAVVGVPAEFLAAKSPAVLLLESLAESRQARALREQSARQLTEAGAWVVRVPAGETSGPTPEAQIALWTLNLKAR